MILSRDSSDKDSQLKDNQTPSPAQSNMRATFPSSSSSSSSRSRHSTPTSPLRELDSSTPRPHEHFALAQQDSRKSRPATPDSDPPVIYDTASRPLSTLLAQGSPSGRESTRSFGAAVHDLYSPTAHSPNAFFDESFQNTPDFFDRPQLRELSQSGVSDLPLGGAVEPVVQTNMSEQRSAPSDSGKQPSRGRSYSNTSRRGQSSRQQPLPLPPQSFQPPVGSYPSLQEQPQGYHGPYPSPTSLYPQRGSFIAGQYTMTTSPPPSVSMGHPPSGGAQYAYPNHPGLHAPDTSMHPQNQIMGYSTNTLMPMMPTHYSFTGHSPEASSPSGHSYVSAAGATSALYSPAHASPTSHSPLSSPPAITSTYGRQPLPYASRFPTPPFMYASSPFAHSGSPMFQTPFSYGQTYRPPVSVPTEAESRSQGTWWYLPPGTRPAPSPHYDAYANPYPVYNPLSAHEVEPYSQPVQQPQHQPQPGPSSIPGSHLHYSVSPHLPLPLPSFAPTRQPSPLAQHSPAPEPPPPLISRSISEPARSEAASTPSLMSRTGSGKPSTPRKPYHPNPPAQRSEWVMWAGNVPSDASHNELWRFFNHSPSPAPPASKASASTSFPAEPVLYGGVSSIFLISRSNCAFVNFQSEAHLHAAIVRFNGHPLRPYDPKCPRLVCRVRAREDDLKAGVGGQRGSGIHVKWIKDQQAKQAQGTRAQSMSAAASPEASSSDRSLMTPSSPEETASLLAASLSLSSGDESGVGTPGAGTLRKARKPAAHSNSSGSYGSTNSSILSQYFPKRYFILKSLTQYDLDLSVEQGVWATQRHNEGILDQAYRTSKDVYLIFGVNKSGEFYGYARMAGPILRARGEPASDQSKVPWAARSSGDSPSVRRSSSSSGAPPSSPSSRKLQQYFSPSDGSRYEESPLPMDESSPQVSVAQRGASAPGILQDPHRPLSMGSAGLPPYGEGSYDRHVSEGVTPAVASVQPHSRSEEFHLDPKAPRRAAKQRSEDVEVDEMGVKRWDTARTSLDSVREEEEIPGASNQQPSPGFSSSAAKGNVEEGEEGAQVQKKEEGPVWGESFRVEWMRATRLPFHQTRHLRNPWNHDREVKVSRDGTELEPSVGQALLDEWDKPEPPSTSVPPRSGTKSIPPHAGLGEDITPG